MNRPLRLHDPVLAAALAAIAVTGCHSPMTSAFPPSPAGSEAVPPNMVPPPGHGPYTGTVADWPLWFVRHNFGAHCFDTQSCEVLYNGFPHGSEEPSPSVASYGRSRDGLLKAGFLSIANFPPPAVVAWKSKDGTSLRAEIDIGEIFKDRLIRHNLKREEISETASISHPDIILEVNDRTIKVYMRARISTKSLQIPDNKYSDYRDDLIEVFSRTY
ncbi:hypothetical protein [Luteimonas notoginsengisoli]|uniref:Uncharacterized protein n=1 Tax=Luteimonas notoginsengisoli TaxID=1578200 RepID=A0ABV7UVB2_9GAMM